MWKNQDIIFYNVYSHIHYIGLADCGIRFINFVNALNEMA